MDEVSKCNACNSVFSRRQTANPPVHCQLCHKGVHWFCAGLGMYEYLDLKGDGNLGSYKFSCKACTPDKV